MGYYCTTAIRCVWSAAQTHKTNDPQMKRILGASPRVSDTSRWAEGSSWCSPHQAWTPAAECTLEQRGKSPRLYTRSCPRGRRLSDYGGWDSLPSSSHLYPWRGWTARQCRPRRWVWLGSLRHREVGCGTGSPLRRTLCQLLFLWRPARQLCPGGRLSRRPSALRWGDCRPWWVWWWSAAALGGHSVSFLLPKYPARKWWH